MARVRAVPILVPVVVLALLLAAALPAAARHPQEAEPVMTFRGPDGVVHHSGPRVVRPPAIVPLDHWSYPLLDRLVTRGIIELDLTTLPVSRRDVLDALSQLDPKLTGIAQERAGGEEGRAEAVSELTPRERWRIRMLAAEFDRATIDAPTAHMRDGDARLGLGLVVSMSGSYVGADARPKGTVTPTALPGAIRDGLVPDAGDTIALPSLDDEFAIDATVRYEVWGGLGDGIGVYSDATVVFHGQQDVRIDPVSTRERAWRGMTVDLLHGYLMVERPHWRLTLGRSASAWGRSEHGRLLLSGNAPTLDGYEARASIGPLTFTSLHSILEYEQIGTETGLGVDDRVFLAGHRLAVSGRTFSVGLNEVVVYSRAIPDPVYLNPLVPYYVSQHNERADDNIFWSLDVDWRPAPEHDLYGELLADDLQYDRDTDNPDKYAATFGYRYAGVLFDRTDVELSVEYSHVRKWVYTHKWVEHRLEHDGLPLGFELGPDSDRLMIEALVHPRRHLGVALQYAHSRKGEGSIRIPYVKGVDDPDTAFPSGDVRTVDSIRISLEHDDLSGFTSGISVGYFRVDGDDPLDESIWEVTGHVGFRI